MNTPYLYRVRSRGGIVWEDYHHSPELRRAYEEANKVEAYRPVKIEIIPNPFYHVDVKVEIND